VLAALGGLAKHEPVNLARLAGKGAAVFVALAENHRAAGTFE
jgi:hypothetical protein